MTAIGLRRYRDTRMHRRASRRDASRNACLFCESLVVAAYNLCHDDLSAATRKSASIAFARQVAMYLAHIAFGLSKSQIGRGFGRDRTTVAHACRTVEDRRDDPRFETILVCLENAAQTWSRYAGGEREAC